MPIQPVYGPNGQIVRYEAVGSPGAAQSAPQPAQQAQQQEEESPSFLGEAGRALVGGARDAVQEGIETIDYLGDSLTEALGAPAITERGLEWLSADEIRQRGLADEESFWGDLDGTGVYSLPEVGENRTTAGNVARGISQFVTGFVGAGKALKGIGVGTRVLSGTGLASSAGRGALVGSVADFAAFDAHEERFANFLRDTVGLEDPVTDFLAADEDDTIAEGKFKNVLEGLGLGVAAEGLFAVTRIFKSAKKTANAKGAEAGAEEMNAGLAKLEEEQPGLIRQMSLFDDVSDPNLARPEIADAQKRAEDVNADPFARAEPGKEVAGEASLYNAVGLIRPEARPTSPINQEQFRKVWTNKVFHKQAAGSGGELNFADWSEGRLFNHDYMDGAPEIRATLNVAADAIDPSALPKSTTFEKIYRGARRELANATRTSPDALDATIRRMASDAARQKRVVVAGKMMIQDLAREINSLATKVDYDAAAGRDTVADEAKLLRYVGRLGELEGNLKQIITGSAQTTAAGRIRTTDVLTGKEMNVQDVMEQLRSSVDAAGGSKKVRDLARKLRAAGENGRNIQGIMDLSRKTGWGKTMDVHNEYWINAILSGPKTHMVNIMSNMAHTALLPAERMIGGALTLDRKAVVEGARMYAGMRSAILDSFKMAGKAFWREQNILDPQGQIMEGTTAQYRAISGQTFGLRDGPMGNIVDMVGKVVRFPSRALLTADEFFKQLNYRSMVHARMVGKANELVDAGKIKSKDVPQWIANQIEATFDGAGRAGADDALEYAREVTFTKELESGTFGRSVQNLVNRHPAMRMILPFVRTPTNILKATWQRTPLLNKLEGRMKADLTSGDPMRVAAARGKQATGAALWSGAIVLAMDGRVTGGGPNDPKLRQRLLETGWQPYSFVLGNEEDGYRYVQYRRMDPFATFFGMAADFADMSGHMGEAELGDLGTMMVTAISNNLVSKTYLTGVVDLVKAIAMPDWYAERWLQRWTSSYVPYSSAQRQIRAQEDEAMREVWSIMDSIKNTIPGLSKTLPARRSWITGEPISYPKGWGADMVSPVGEALAAANPIIQGEPKGDAVLDELARLQHGFSAPQKKIRGVELSSEQYSRLLELHGTIRIGRYTLHERLARLVDSAGYKDGAERRVDPDAYRLHRVREVIRDYRDRAKEVLSREDTKLAEDLRRAREEHGLRVRRAVGPVTKILGQ